MEDNLKPMKRKPRVRTDIVKVACENCARYNKKCSTERPCKECVRRNLDKCVDKPRKQSRKFKKKAPVKKTKEIPAATDHSSNSMSDSELAATLLQGLKNKSFLPEELESSATSTVYIQHPSLSPTETPEASTSRQLSPSQTQTERSAQEQCGKLMLGNTVYTSTRRRPRP